MAEANHTFYLLCRVKSSNLCLSFLQPSTHVLISHDYAEIALKTEPENVLNQQYEYKIRPCIDLIDSLRSLGVEKDLGLPAIAVIGDQSSGKSSVLEALSGVCLPRGSGKNYFSNLHPHSETRSYIFRMSIYCSMLLKLKIVAVKNSSF